MAGILALAEVRTTGAVWQPITRTQYRPFLLVGSNGPRGEKENSDTRSRGLTPSAIPFTDVSLGARLYISESSGIYGLMVYYTLKEIAKTW